MALHFAAGELARLSLLLPLILAAPSGRPASQSPQIAPLAASRDYLYPEVRLRKLHLVRPDLINYPISYEIYC